tara:strand:- start:86 stop:313 length:228 start_codon:yes stop_codon:yes gene_type:complete
MTNIFKKKSKERWKISLAVPAEFKERIDNIKKFLSDKLPDQEFDYHDFLEESLDKHIKRAEKEIASFESKNRKSD